MKIPREINSKERALRAIRHEEPDSVPLDYWAVPGITAALIEKLGLENLESLLEYFRVDFRYIFPQYSGPPPDASTEWREDIWQVRRDLKYNEVVRAPLALADSAPDLENYEWPHAGLYDCSALHSACAHTGEFCTILCDERTNRTSVLHQGIYLRGIENMMVDFISRPGFVHELFDRITDFYSGLNRRIFESACPGIDVILIGDDLGTQEGLLISRNMLEEFVYPRLKKHFDMAHEYGVKVMFHSCGAIREIIPDLIELGVDILNPVQSGARGMDPRGLKEEFGDRLCFHGSMDTQQTLPFGSEKDVREQVRQRIETLSPGGGFILAPTHNFQAGTPLENIIAMYDEAAKFQ